jgi:hypothetical protein
VTALIVVGFVLLLLAMVAWGSAWKTMEWLGELEDLVDDVLAGGSLERLARWKRKTPLHKERA